MRNLLAFLRRFRVFLIFAGLQVLALWLYFSFFQFPKTQYLTSASKISGSIHEVSHSVSKHFGLEYNNIKLQKENARLRKLIPKNQLKVERRLYKVNDTTYKQQYEYIPAQVINSTVTKRNNFFTLDAGSNQGIERGMGVISSNGVVGIVHNVSANMCVVKSILTQGIRVDVAIESMGLFGLLTWNGQNPTLGSVIGISNDLDLKKGEMVVTRGGAGIFPKGIAVGRIVSFEEIEGEAFWDVTIRYAEDYRKLTHVYVVKNYLLDEQRTLESSINTEEE